MVTLGVMHQLHVILKASYGCDSVVNPVVNISVSYHKYLITFLFVNIYTTRVKPADQCITC